MRKEVKIGFTNKSKFIEGDKFIIEKTYTGFNHNLDYSVLSEFDFVPKLITNNKKEIVWENIDGSCLKQNERTYLKEIATILRKVHKSDVKLPKNNMKKRVMHYLKIVHEKKLHVPEIEDNFKKMIRMFSKMSNINPIHNDVWCENIMIEKNNKVWLVDWEYATMGDKHFDLAYFIESQKLSEHEEEIFLKAYDDVDKESSYNKSLISKYKILVNWITLCWAYSQDELPFSVDDIKKALKKHTI